jgi:hypothetical protein
MRCKERNATVNGLQKGMKGAVFFEQRLIKANQFQIWNQHEKCNKTNINTL